MRSFVHYIPFIAVPFLFPEVSPLLRLWAHLFLASLCIFYLYQEFLNPWDINHRSLFSPAILIILICTALLDLTIVGSGFLQTIWPTYVSGTLLLIAIGCSPVTPLRGITVTCAVLWIILLLSPQIPDLLPSEHFATIVSHQFPAVTFQETGEIPYVSPVYPPVIPPVSKSANLFFRIAVLLTTTLAFMIAFKTPSKIPSFLRGLLLFLWCIALFLLAGREAFILLGAHVLIFLLFCSDPGTFSQTNNRIALVFFLLFCLIGYKFRLTLLLERVISPYPLHEYLFGQYYRFPLFGILSEGFSNFTFSSRITSFLAFIIVFYLLIILFFRVRHRSLKDVAYPAALVLLIFIVSSTVNGLQTPPWLTLLAHPLLWMFAGIMHYRNRIERRASIFIFDYTLHAFALLGGLLLLASTADLYKEWRAQAAINRFSRAESISDQIRAANRAYSWARYRGDNASIYITAFMQGLIQEGITPTSEQIMQLDSALFVSTRQGYIPLLSYKLLSDVFMLSGEHEKAVLVLRAASARFPKQLALCELLADRLYYMNRLEDAIRQYKHCINIDPASPRIRYKLALAYRSSGRMEEFQVMFRQLITLDPTLRPR